MRVNSALPCAVALLKTTDIHCAFLLVAGLCRILILRLSLQKRAKRWRHCWTHSACEGHLWPADFVAWRVERRVRCNRCLGQGPGVTPTTLNATKTQLSARNRRVRCSRRQGQGRGTAPTTPNATKTRLSKQNRRTKRSRGTCSRRETPRPIQKQRSIDSKALASRGTYCVRRSQGLVPSDRRLSYWYSTLYRITLCPPIS